MCHEMLEEGSVRGQIESLLDRGIEAARANEKDRARDILIHVIELDQHNEQAWLWLSSVVKTSTDKEVCLENTLLINPENTYAAMGLNHLRQQPELGISPPTTLLRLAGPSSPAKRSQRSSTAQASPPPAVRVCPRCQFRNPGWAYLCDRCGANLRQVNVRQAVSKASEPRGRNFFTLLEAWGGAITFNRLYAFLPEVELASWGRSLAALIMAMIFASIWRPTMSLALWLITSGGPWRNQIAFNALRSAAHTLPLTLPLTLICVSIALLTWIVARLAGGEQNPKIHLHLAIVAFSAWIVLIALLVPLTILVPYLLGGDTRFDLPFDVVQVLVGVAVSISGPIWLMQAIRTAQDFSFVRATMVALMLAVIGVLLFLGLNGMTGGEFADFLSKLVTAPFLPLPSLE